MPTLDNPRHFETGRLMPNRYDQFFKWWVSTDVEPPNHQTGEVESPGGFVSLFYIVGEYEIVEYMDLHTFAAFSEALPEYRDLQAGIKTGWYVTLQDNNGLIWAFEFGDGTLAEENARREFAGSEEFYHDWSLLLPGQEPR